MEVDIRPRMASRSNDDLGGPVGDSTAVEPAPAQDDEAEGQRRVLALINPAAGTGDQVEQVRGALERWVEGAELAVRETSGAGDARRWGVEANKNEGQDLLVVAGGDGTLREAIDGLVTSEAPKLPVALVPTGTGNVVAKHFGISKEPEQALGALGSARSVGLDLGRVDGSKGGYFLIAAGAGYPADLMDAASREAKNKLGFLAYLFSALRQLFGRKERWLHLICDGEEHFIRAKSVLILNMPLPWLSWLNEKVLRAPIDPEDGVLDVLVPERPSTLGLFKSLLLRLLGREPESPKLHHFRVKRRVEVSTAPPLPTQIDGDPLAETPLKVEVVTGQCHLLVPGSERRMSSSGGRRKEGP